MPLNGFSVGRDIRVDIVTPTGPLTLTEITDFHASPNTHEENVLGIDGVVRPLVFPQGWKGRFMTKRTDSTLDDFWALFEANYYAGGPQLSSSISETITEPDGSVSQYLFSGVLFKLDNAGEWKGDSSVAQELSFMAQTRIKLA